MYNAGGWVSRVTACIIRDLDTRWRKVVSLTAWPLDCQVKEQLVSIG